MRHSLSSLELLLHAALLLGGASFVLGYWYVTSVADGADNAGFDASEILHEIHASDYHLILFVSPTCTFCDRSMPFYAALSNQVMGINQLKLPLSLVAVMGVSESRDAQHHAFLTHDVALDTLVATSLPEVGVNRVPMIALVRGDGSTVRTWTGLLAEQEEDEVLNEVLRLTAAH
ncbi:MAG: hypothetical protein GVY15_04560 [Bacteroidetes bacterium]|jgi:hypothetical protein|nr:hypothetical protein [Bacteroidota bacterium]